MYLKKAKEDNIETAGFRQHPLCFHGDILVALMMEIK